MLYRVINSYLIILACLKLPSETFSPICYSLTEISTKLNVFLSNVNVYLTNEGDHRFLLYDLVANAIDGMQPPHELSLKFLLKMNFLITI